MNLLRVLVIAKNVFWEVFRDRILYLIAFFALLLLIVQRILPEVAATTEGKMLLDFGLAIMSILALIVAVFVGTGLINKEIEKRTVYILIAKPVSATELIVGKHLGLSAVLAVLIAAMTGIYLGVLQISATAYPSLNSLLLAAVFLLLQMSLMAAVAILFGTFSSSILATLLTLGVYFMGNLSQDMVKLNQLVENPDFQRLTKALFLIFPDLSRLDLKNLAVYGMGSLPSPETLALNAGYGVAYAIFLLAIAIMIFSYREF